MGFPEKFHNWSGNNQEGMIKIVRAPSDEYFAGFFDGEGSINIKELRQAGIGLPNWAPRVTFANTHREIIRAIQKRFGGRIDINSRLRGGVEKRWRDCYNLWLSGESATAALLAMLPYLKVKKYQAELALMFQADKTGEGGSTRLTDSRRAFRRWIAETVTHLNKGRRTVICANM